MGLKDWIDSAKDVFGIGSGDSVRIEGRQGSEHSHKGGDRGSGSDTYAAKVSYRDGEKVGERNAGFGHISGKEDGSKEGHVK